MVFDCKNCILFILVDNFIARKVAFIIFDLAVTKLIHSLWAVKTLAV